LFIRKLQWLKVEGLVFRNVSTALPYNQLPLQSFPSLSEHSSNSRVYTESKPCSRGQDFSKIKHHAEVPIHNHSILVYPINITWKSKQNIFAVFL